MISFKKQKAISGKAKNIVVTGDGKFADAETGEYINLANILFDTFNGMPFDMTFTQKSEEDVAPTTEE